MKVSVIMPAWNAERYLAEAVESMLMQTLDETELIVVDNGSTDSTPDMLRAYAQHYPNVTVLHTENDGPAAARNLALTKATGEFCFFLDADDILVGDALEALYQRATAQKADLVIANYDVFGRYTTKITHNIDSLLGKDTISPYDPAILWTFSLWNKLYRTSLIKELHLRFPPLYYSEDAVFVMQYVYHARKITGLNKIVLHYRRMYDGETQAITSFINESKLQDYLDAHRMIYEAMQESFRQENGQSRENTAFYFSEFQRKCAQILINQFYRHYWEMDGAVSRKIADILNDSLSKADLYTAGRLQNSHLDFIENRFVESDPDKLMQKPVFAAIFSVGRDLDGKQKASFGQTLSSLNHQTLFKLAIYLPAYTREWAMEQGLLQGNQVFLETEEAVFCREAFEQACSTYVFFPQVGFLYGSNLLRDVELIMRRKGLSGLMYQVYRADDGAPHPLYLHEWLLEELKRKKGTTVHALDGLLANRFWKRAYIQENGIPETCRGEIDEEIVPDEGVTFEGDEEAFAAFLGATREDAWYQEIMDSPDKIHLADAAYRPDTPAAWQKLQDSPGEDVSSKIRKRLLRWMEKLPVKNQVFFYSIRSDGELEGNAKALYPWIQGKKIYRAKRLPHDKNWEMQMYYLICTSKVIVTDDYVRYLRHVRLKSSQRVIQLWHACGAFKRFGRLGTNIALDTDIATHAQYSLCCVSGEAIRLTYADAFAIPPRRVAALGVPRTDLFFDRAYIDSVKNRLYQAFPQFAGKKIFLHAPTFRDVGRDRRVFVPELDFDTFSAHLPENTILLICPHPIMTEPILHREYPNILEIRDYSTNEMMFVSDLLITDYSSVIFEYALLRKPMVFFCYDLAIYNRGFYLRYPEDLPGSVVTNQEELESYLGDETRQLVDERYEQFLRRYMTACDGNSSRRIAGIIQEML